MKWINLASILLIFAVSGTPVPTQAQDINFKDLTREGRPVVKRYTVEGVEADGREYVTHFQGVDTARVQANRAAAAHAASNRSEESKSNSSSGSSKSNSSAANTSAAKPTKTYACLIYCNSSNGPTITREISATNRSEAAKFMGDNADKICQNTGYSRASSVSFPESQCRER